ncbi:hypothetical protein ACFLS8_01985, partial [Chloroflexota bacterium]
MKVITLIILTIILVAISLVGCGDGGGEAVPFSIQVVPQQMDDTVPGQICVFLVTTQSDDTAKAINISATASGASLTVSPQTIKPGQVTEVTAIPDDSSIGKRLTITIEGERGGLTEIETASLVVEEAIPESIELLQVAVEVRDAFIPWLAANHPEFGITAETEWIPTVVRPHFMVVMYYLFYSDEWEMGVRWHVMIPPY